MAQAHSERRRQSTADLVSAILRALGAAFSRGGPDPYDGLVDKAQGAPISPEQVRWLRFWRPSDGH